MANLSVAPVQGEVVEGSSFAQREQRARALERANRVRSVVADTKRRVAAGSLPVVDVLAEPPVELCGTRVMDVLVATPKVGPVKARSALWACGMSLMVRFGDLTPARRAQLAGALEARGYGCLNEAAHKPIVAKAGTKR